MRRRPLLLIVIGFIMSGHFANLGWGYYSTGKASESWPSVPGRISSSQVIRSGKMYEARVIYDYEVNGQKLRGNQIGFMDGSTSNVRSIESVVQEFPEGKEVQVFYNPSVPVEAYLQPGGGIRPFLMMGGGGLGLLFFLNMLVFGTTARIRRSGSF